MEDRQYPVDLYLYDKPFLLNPIEFFQNDTESCAIAFTFNSDSINKFDITNKTVEIRVTKQDLTTVDDVATITGPNKAVWELKLSAISIAGPCSVTVYVYENSERLTFGTFKYKVIADAEAGNVSTQPDYPILTQLIADVQDAINETNQTSDNISAVEATRVADENIRKENEVNRNIQFNSKMTVMDDLEDSLNASEANRTTEFNGIKTEYGTLKNVMIDENNAVELQNQVNTINTQLAEQTTELTTKRDKSVKITCADLDTSSNANKLQIINLSDEVKQAMAGTTSINATLANGSLVKEKFTQNSISPYVTRFLTEGKNKFNKNTAVGGYRLDGSVNADWYVSDYFPVLPSTPYKRKNAYTTYFYKADFSFISAVVTTGFTTPLNAAYAKIETYVTTLDTEQVELGSVSTTYENYGVKLTSQLDKSLSRSVLDDTAKLDSFPFQPMANFGSIDNEAIIRKAIKKIELSNANFLKKYCVYIIERNHATYGTGVFIYECDASGVAVTCVAKTEIVGYTEPVGIDVFNLAEYNNSGISAKVYIDWSLITNNAQLVFNHFDKSGLDVRTYDNSNQNSIQMMLPPKINGLVGKEVNIYFDNVILCDDIKDYQITVTCSIGKQQNERWTCIPSAPGTYTLTLKAYRNGLVVATATTNVIIKATSVGSGINKKCVFIGDSTTDAGIYTQELNTLFGSNDVMDITLLGTRGIAPNLHEGRGGWKTSDYTTKATSGGITNAFYNSGFDFSYYMTQQGYSTVDVVGIHLGINDIFGYFDDTSLNAEITNILNRFDIMINSIKLYNASIKIGIMITIPPSKNQDSFGKNYDCTQTQWRYKRNNFLFSKALINKYTGQEAQNIYLIPINTNLDTEHNMQKETVAVNSRNSSTVVRQSNGVHPDDGGYYQMADIIYYWIKGQES